MITDFVWRRSLPVSFIVATSCAVALSLPAASGAKTGTGGTLSSLPPTLSAVECLRGCAGIDVARPGSLVRITGAELATVKTVTFVGGSSTTDDVTAAVRSLSSAGARSNVTLTVFVPTNARSGPIVAANSDGLFSTDKLTLTIDRKPPPASGSGAVEARISTKTVLFGGKNKAVLTYLLQPGAPAKLSVGLVRVKSGELVRTWQPGVVEPGVTRTVTWNGRDQRGAVAPDGQYRFRVVAGDQLTPPAAPTGDQGTGGVRAARATDTAASPKLSFRFLQHIFPVRGPHDYGTFTNSFGGGRNHGGQDVLSPCGTPLVAARGGKVIASDMENGGGGNTVVIDGLGTDVIYVYYHMRDTPLPKVGEIVWTGQLIGFVGSTGSSTACHLHLELHHGGNWYDDSRAFDPLPSLKAWDGLS